MPLKKTIIVFLTAAVLTGISFAGETKNADSLVNNLINSPRGIQLYNLEVEISMQKKQNELLKLKEDAIKMQKEIETANSPMPPVLQTTVPSYQFPSKGYFSPSPYFNNLFPSTLKNKKKNFTVLMVEKNINALIKKNGEFYFIRAGDKLNGAIVTKISGYGITLDKKETKTFYPVSIIIQNNTPTMPLMKK